MYENLQLPIVILSTPRSGSTALVFDVVNHFKDKIKDLQWLIEPKIDIGNHNYLQFFKDQKIYSESDFSTLTSSNFILKVHAYEVEHHYPNNFKLRLKNKEFSIIRIRRRNLIDQYVSYYISIVTKIWANDGTKNNFYENFIAPIDDDKIKKTISDVNRHNKSLANIEVVPDVELYYEDCTFFTKDLVKNTQIKNYTDIRNIFERIVDEKNTDNGFTGGR